MDMGFNIVDALDSPVVPPDTINAVEDSEESKTDSALLIEILKSVTRIEEMMKGSMAPPPMPSQSPMLDATEFNY